MCPHLAHGCQHIPLGESLLEDKDPWRLLLLCFGSIRI